MNFTATTGTSAETGATDAFAHVTYARVDESEEPQRNEMNRACWMRYYEAQNESGVFELSALSRTGR